MLMKWKIILRKRVKNNGFGMDKNVTLSNKIKLKFKLKKQNNINIYNTLSNRQKTLNKKTLTQYYKENLHILSSSIIKKKITEK